MTIDNGGPAFPVHGGHHPDDDPRNQILGGGMSLRDWFAGQAMSAEVTTWDSDTEGYEHNIARRAYRMADAMLAARNSTPTKGA